MARARRSPPTSTLQARRQHFHERRLVLQRYARKLGFDRRPGSTCPGGRRRHPDPLAPPSSGGDRVPQAQGPVAGDGRLRRRGRRLRPIGPACHDLGDNASLAVGQGDMQATPLQPRVAYAAIQNKARSSCRTSAWRSSAPTASSCSASSATPRAGEHRRGRPIAVEQACISRRAPRAHVGRRVRRLAAERAAGLRQDRHRRARGKQDILVRGLRTAPQEPDRRRGDGRGGRLRRCHRGADRPAELAKFYDLENVPCARGGERRAMTSPRQPPARRPGLPFVPLLALAALA